MTTHQHRLEVSAMAASARWWHLLLMICCGLSMGRAQDIPLKATAESKPSKLNSEDNPYVQINQARNLLMVRQFSAAQQIFNRLETNTTDARVLIEIFRAQAHGSRTRGDLTDAKKSYEKVFDLVLNPKGPTDSVSRIGAQVIASLNECNAMLASAKQPIISSTVRDRIVREIEIDFRAKTAKNPTIETVLLNEHLQRARDYTRARMTNEAVAEYEYVFEMFPKWLQEPVAINTKFAWIQAHGHARNSPQRIELLERLYNDPIWQNNPRIANMGVHLGMAYETIKNPNAESHWKSVVEQTERFQTFPANPPEVKTLLRENYEFALASYAGMLKRRGVMDEAELAMRKLTTELPGSEGAKFAEQSLEQIGAVKNRKYRKWIATGIVSAALGLGAVLVLYNRLRMRSS
jgi:tetratricopeptide (TPR) repeat protein